MPGRSPLPAPPLFCEIGLLALVAGVLAFDNPLPAATAALLLFWVDPRARGARLLVLFACCGAGLALGWYASPKTLPEYGPEYGPDHGPDWIAAEVRVRGRVVATRNLPDNRLRVVLSQVSPVEKQESPDASPSLPAKLAWSWEQPTHTPLPGQFVTATLKIRPVRGFSNTVGPDFAAYWQRQGVAWTSWARGTKADVSLDGEGLPFYVWRQHMRERVDALLSNGSEPQEADSQVGKALIPALLFADQSALSTQNLDLVTSAGLRHSLALSGQHLAVVGLLALIPVLLVGRAQAHIFLYIPRRILIGVLSLPLAGLCLWLGDAPPSLVRAALMLCIWVILFWRGTAMTLWDGLCLALACMLVLDPGCLSELGVRLSFLAVAGMAVASPLLSHYATPRALGHALTRCGVPASVRAPTLRCVRWLIWGLGISGAAWLATLPLSIHTFGRAPSGLLFNLLWLPVLGLVVLPAAWGGLFLLLAGWQEGARSLMHLASLPGTWLLEGLEKIDSLGLLEPGLCLRPHWTAALGYSALLASLAALAGSSGASRAAKRLAIAGVILSLIAPGLRLFTPTDLRIQLVDVGQGQAALVEWPGGRVVIDSGGFASLRLDSGRDILGPILTNNRPPRLHALFASHMDRDHVGGMPFLLKHFTVGTWRIGRLEAREQSSPRQTSTDFTPREAFLTTTDLERRLLDFNPQTMSSGERVDLAPDVWLEALWPPAGQALRGNDSLVLRLVRAGQGLALFCGDIEPREQRAMIALHGPEKVQAAILVLPHHGSRKNLEPQLYAATQASVAVVSAGAGNRWNFPSDEVRAALHALDIPMFNTAYSGALEMRVLDQNTVEVQELRYKKTTSHRPVMDKKEY